ncbi:MAG: Zn-dependent hydrolase [Trueperaceae bacterium]
MSTSQHRPNVDVERIARRIDALAALTEPDRPYTRRAFTDLYLRARDWLRSEFEGAGLEVHLDAGANLIGKRRGSEPGRSALAVGSHVDTVVGGGRFDGIAGVVAGLEAAQALRESGTTLRHDLWVVDFLSEEPSDYGASCVGSRALAGTLSPAMLQGKNPAGETLDAAIRRMGGRPEDLGSPLVQDLAAFLELHIEQGPVLMQESKRIGIVEGIVAIHRVTLTVQGQAAHAGTTPMSMRRDALVGAARIVDNVWTQARELASREQFVATIGRFDVAPNGANVVPGSVRLIVEARALDVTLVERFLHETVARSRELGDELGLEVTSELTSTAAAAKCDARVIAALEQSCRNRETPFRRMSSGAGHDAMQVATVAPMGMVFIPCKDGISHNPAESARAEDVAAGAEVIADALVTLDASGRSPAA